MTDAFDLFDKNGLITQEKIESLIMGKWSKKQVLDFNESLYDAMPAMASVKNDIEKFRFVVNSNLSAQLWGNCQAWDCRLRSIDKLSRFAALYADGVYIQDYYVPDLVELFEEDEMEARHAYAGNLKVLSYLRPLIESGIVVLVNHPAEHICPDCIAKEFPSLEKQINLARADFPSLATKYLGKTTASINVEDLIQNGQLSIKFSGSTEIFHEGHTIWVPSKTPTWIKQKIKRALDQKNKPKQIALAEDEILKTDIIQDILQTALNDILLQKMYSQGLGLNTKYLTDRDADFQILKSMTDNADNVAVTNMNDNLANTLLYEMPIIQDVSIEYLLKIRKDDYDAFLNFKNSMSQVVNKYIAQHKTITKREAQQLYLDEIYPQVCKLNRKVNTIRSTAIKKLVKDVIISASVITVGWFSGILPPIVKEALTGLGLLKPAQEIPKSVFDIVTAEDEIRNEDLYFLWKIKKGKQKFR